MNAASTVVGIVVSLAALLASFWRLGRAIWHAGKSTQELVGAVKDNTTATAALSERFDAHSAEIRAIVADHAERLTRLETLRR